jgi:hypothetical protein
MEYIERRELMFKKEIAAKNKKMKQNIADEKRKWKVIPRTSGIHRKFITCHRSIFFFNFILYLCCFGWSVWR